MSEDLRRALEQKAARADQQAAWTPASSRPFSRADRAQHRNDAAYWAGFAAGLRAAITALLLQREEQERTPT